MAGYCVHIQYWGRLCDVLTPHSLSIFFQVTPGSKASSANLCVGDVILAIEGVPAKELLHCEAQNRIKECTSRLCLTIDRSARNSRTHSRLETCAQCHDIQHIRRPLIQACVC